MTMMIWFQAYCFCFLFVGLLLQNQKHIKMFVLEPFLTEVKFCPTDLLHATRRPRVYYILIRAEAALAVDLAALFTHIFEEVLKKATPRTVDSMLLPRNHALLRKWLPDRTGLNSREKGVIASVLKKKKVGPAPQRLIADVSQSLPYCLFSSG